MGRQAAVVGGPPARCEAHEEPLRIIGAAPLALPPCRPAAATAACRHRPHPASPPSCFPHADDSSLLAVLLDVSPAGLEHLAATPGLGLQSLLQQVRRTVRAMPAAPLVLDPLEERACGC